MIMDAVGYTLIGTLGGILITQIANYFLEDKKAQNLIKLKELDVKHQNNSELQRERRDIYANYLAELDGFAGRNNADIMKIIPLFYKALIVANESTRNEINNTFTILKKKERDTDEYLKAKRDLLKAMRDEI